MAQKISAIIFSIITITIFIEYLRFCKNWINYQSENLKKADSILTFKQFLTFYEINPNKYNLYKYYPQRKEVKIYEPKKNKPYHYEPVCCENNINIGFKSFGGYLRYIHFYKKETKRSATEEHERKIALNTQDFLNRVKQDIKELEDQSEREIKSAVEIVENLKG